MINRNIQMKKKNNGIWENLFPITLTENVFSNEGLNLNDHLENVDDQLKQIEINVESFGAKGDGITDDTQAFKDAIAFGGANSRLTLPGGDYIIKEPLLIENDFVTIDGKGSRLIYLGTSEVKDSTGNHGVGIITFKGEGLSSTTQNIQHVATHRSGDHTIYGTRVRVSNTDSFNVGEYVILNLNAGVHKTDLSDYKPQTTLLLPIADKVGTDIFFDYVTPFDYERVGYTGEITKANVIQSPSVKNLEIIDRSENPNELTWTSALTFTYATNIHVDNYKTVGFKNKGLRVSSSYRGKVSNCRFERPYSTEAGNGYGSQFVGSSFFDIENVSGLKNRHLIDFSKSVYMDVSKSGSSSSINGDFDCHGNGEHDITFTLCKGTFVFGNGSQFISVTENIKIDKSTVYNIQGSFVNNLKITNSRVERFAFAENTTNNVSFINCDLSDQPRNIYLNYNDRGGYFKKSTFEMIDSIFTPKPVTPNETLTIRLGGAEEITIKGNYMKHENNDLHLIIYIMGASERLLIENNLIYDTRILLGSGTYNHVQFHKNTVKNKIGGFAIIDMISPISSEPVFILSIRDNHFDAEKQTNWLRLQKIVDLSKNYVVFQIFNNIFTGVLWENISFSENDLIATSRSSGGNLNFSEPEFPTKLFTD